MGLKSQLLVPAELLISSQAREFINMLYLYLPYDESYGIEEKQCLEENV